MNRAHGRAVVAHGSTIRLWGALVSGSMASIAAVALMLSSMAGDWVWPDGSDWQALWTFATFVVATGAVVIALRQLRAHHAAQWELSRPYVIVDFAFRGQTLLIEVRNIGATPAQAVRVGWSEPPVAVDPGLTAALVRNLVDGQIPFLAPLRGVRYFLGTTPEYLSDPSRPTRYEVTTSYQDATGRPIEGEVMVLDLDQWAHTLVDSDYENKNWNEFKRQAAAQKDIASAIGAVGRQLDRLAEASPPCRGERQKDLQ